MTTQSGGRWPAAGPPFMDFLVRNGISLMPNESKVANSTKSLAQFPVVIMLKFLMSTEKM